MIYKKEEYMRLIIAILLTTSFFGCSSDSNDKFVYSLEPLEEQQIYSNSFALKDLDFSNKIDILFVVDDSGSMDEIQSNVERNADIFFSQFAQQSYIRWKLGIITTSSTRDPILGFDSSFDSTLIDPRDSSTFNQAVEEFQTAVRTIGTSGDGTEKSYYNVIRQLDEYESNGNPFLRPSSHFVVIFVTDEAEQSSTQSLAFYEMMQNRLGFGKIFRAFGAFGHYDLEDCRRTSWNASYEGSKFEQLILKSDGFHISACTDEFGKDLARVGESIATLVNLPSLLLRNVPLVDTINVVYEGVRLTPGRESEGGQWFYQEDYNAIFFHNLDFVKDFERDSIIVEFDIQDGIDRDQPGPISRN